MLTDQLRGITAPAGNERRSLHRHEPPDPLLLPIGAGRLLHEASTLDSLDTAHPATLAGGSRLVMSHALDAGRTAVVRLIGGSTGPARASLESTGLPLAIEVGADGSTTWSGPATSNKAETRWVELHASASGVAMFDDRRRPLDVPPEVAVSALVVDPHSCGAHHVFLTGGASSPMPAPRLVDTIVDRIDQITGWRSFGDWIRPIDLFALPSPDTPPVHPGPRVEMLGYLSEGWEGRRTCGQWTFHSRDGGAVSATEVEAYGRGGGLVLFVRDPGTSRPAPATGSIDAGSELFRGDRRDWMAAVRHCDALLYQAAATAYRHDTDRTRLSDDVDQLMAALATTWHPLFAHHVDVIDVMARGVGRYRYSDPDHAARTAAVIASMASRLADLGISSRAVVVS